MCERTTPREQQNHPLWCRHAPRMKKIKSLKMKTFCWRQRRRGVEDGQTNKCIFLRKVNACHTQNSRSVTTVVRTSRTFTFVVCALKKLCQKFCALILKHIFHWYFVCVLLSQSLLRSSRHSSLAHTSGLRKTLASSSCFFGFRTQRNNMLKLLLKWILRWKRCTRKNILLW